MKKSTITNQPDPPKFRLCIFVRGRPGFFTYTVDTVDQAMTHFGEIVAKGYRRVNDRKQMEWYAPAMLEYIKIDGPGLDSGYPDTFQRT